MYWYDLLLLKQLVDYVIMFVSHLRKGQWFSPGILASTINKIDHHNITEILLKVALTTIIITLT